MAALAGECEQVFMAAIFAFDSGKAVVQIATIEITADYLLHIGPPEAVSLSPSPLASPDGGISRLVNDYEWMGG